MRSWRRVCCFLVLVAPAMQDCLEGESREIGYSRIEVRLLREFSTPDFQTYLETIRPKRLSTEDKARVLASLPLEGEVEPEGKLAAKLRNLDRVFDYHDRASQIEVKVVDVPWAAVAFHARCVVLISAPALRILTATQLQAVVAHEMGHDYVWEEYEAGMRRGNFSRVQELELWCDGIAVLTLLDLGVDPHNLMEGISRISRFNEKFGEMADANEYPSDNARAKFHQRILDMKGFGK